VDWWRRKNVDAEVAATDSLAFAELGSSRNLRFVKKLQLDQ
jgi:hypothetical protein